MTVHIIRVYKGIMGGVKAKEQLKITNRMRVTLSHNNTLTIEWISLILPKFPFYIWYIVKKQTPVCEVNEGHAAH